MLHPISLKNIRFRTRIHWIDIAESIVAMMIIAAGVILSAKASLGTSPVASFPYVLSLGTGYSLGTTIFIVYAVFVLCQLIIYRKDRHRQISVLSQLPYTMIFSGFVDIIEMMLTGWTLEGPAECWIAAFSSIILIAFGVTLEVDANVSMLADDGFVLALHEATGIRFGMVTIIFNVSFVTAAFALSYALFREFDGVGVATLLAMVFIGLFVNFFTKVVKKYIRTTGYLD